MTIWLQITWPVAYAQARTPGSIIRAAWVTTVNNWNPAAARGQ